MRRSPAMFLFPVALSLGLAWGAPGAAQNAKGKKADAEADPIELEKLLLTVPDKIADRDAWQKAWRKHLILGFRAPIGRVVDRSLQSFMVDNRTPCTIHVKLREALYKNGKKTKTPPPEDGWEVKASQKLYLGTQPNLQILTIKHDLKPGVAVTAINRGMRAELHVTPNQSDFKPADLAVIIEYGERGAAMGPASWTLVKPEEVEDFLKRK